MNTLLSMIKMNSTEVQTSHAHIRCPIASLWYIRMLVMLNATNNVTMTEVTARLNLEESYQQ